MLLGIVLHAAMVYAVDPWRVHDPSGGPFFTWLVLAIHSFRMPAFFFIAGFFTAMGMDRLDPASYAHRRLQRLLVPFLATLLTFNLAERYIVAKLDPANTHGASGLVGIGHLWFLLDLAIMTCLAILTMQRRSPMARTLEAAGSRLRHSGSLLATLAAATAGVVLATALFRGAVGADSLEIVGIVDFERLLGYTPHFIGGMLVYRCATLRRAFESISPLWFVPAVGLHLWLTLDPGIAGRWSVRVIAQAGLSWLAVAASLSFFRRVFSKAGQLTRWLADASYPIYLSHYLFVVAIGAMMIRTDWPVAMKFLVLLTTATVLALSFSYLVSLVGVLSSLYRGRQLARRQGAEERWAVWQPLRRVASSDTGLPARH